MSPISRFPSKLSRLALPALLGALVAFAPSPVEAQYAVTTPALGQTTIAGGAGTVVVFDNAVATFDDNINTAMTLPFAFQFFGVTKAIGTVLSIDSNGIVSFGTNISDFSNDALPAAAVPNSLLALFWDDLVSQTGSQILMQVQGTAPNRILVIEYVNIDNFNTTLAASMSGQIALFETTNVIQFRYPATGFVIDAGASFTAGVEDDAGAVAFGAGNLLNTNATAPATNFTFTPMAVVQPDLVAQSLNLAQSHVNAGDMITVTRTFANTSSVATAVTFRCGIYLSTDNVITTADMLLTSFTVAGLAANTANGPTNATVTIPAGQTAPFFLGLIVDDQLAVAESSETNNAVASSMVTVGAAVIRSSFAIGLTSINGGAGTTDIFAAPTAFDDVTSPITVPFAFNFAGTLFPAATTLNVCSNGFVNFGASSTALTNTVLPTAGVPNDLIALFWDDLNSNGTTSKIMQQVSGTAPNRVLTIEYFNMIRFGQATSVLNGQIALFETTNVVELRYPTAGQVFTGLSYTNGVENSLGDQGFGGANLLATNATAPTENYRYSPFIPTVPDLRALTLTTAQSHVNAGDTITINRSFTNAGASVATTFRVGVYASTDNIITTSDTLLTSFTVAGLANGVSNGPTNLNVTVPAGQTTAFFIGIFVDDQLAVTETNETNNTAVTTAAIQIGAGYTRSTFALGLTSIDGGAGTTDIFNAATAAFDEQILDIPFPFAFTFFGTPVAASAMVTVRANGFVGLTQTTGAFSLNSALPAAATPNSLVAVLWDDIASKTGSKVLQQTSGTAPNRVFTIEYLNVSRFTDTTATLSGQIAFFETTNVIELRYPTTGQTFTAVTSFSAGIENAAGDQAFGGPSLLANNAAAPTENFRFTPPPAAAGVDLVVTSVTQSVNTVAPGGTVMVTSTVRNNGTVAAGAFRVGLYLSTDTTITTGDVFLSSYTVASLAAATTAAANTTTVTIPAGTTPGNFFIGAIVDDLLAVTEVTETNNAAAVATALNVGVAGTDLIVNSITQSATTVAPGGTVMVTSAVQNTGTTAAGAFTLGFFLSTDNVITTGDTAIGTMSFASLAGSTTSTSATMTLTIPAGTTPGTYFIGAFVDSASVITETLETNNGLAVTASITVAVAGTDLVVLSATQSVNTVALGGTVTVTTVVRNNNGTAAGAFRVGVYLSTDTTITTADVLVGNMAITSLAGGTSTASLSIVATIPGGTTPGTFSLGVIVDDQLAVTETSETNNALAITPTLTVTATAQTDLSVVGPVAVPGNTVTTPGTTFNLTTSVIHNGGLAAGAFRVGLYLSTDNVITSADTLIGSLSVASLAAATPSGTLTVSCTIPAAQAEGLFFVGVIVDDQLAVTESSEANNSLSSIASITTRRGDVDGNNVTNAADIGTCIDRILLRSAVNGLTDQNKDGSVNIFDLQIVVNRANGLAVP